MRHSPTRGAHATRPDRPATGKRHDLRTTEHIDFVDEPTEALQERIAERLGYRLKGHRLELYGVPLKPRR